MPAPKGNTNAAKGRLWREALDKELKQYESKDAGIKRGQALRKIARNVVEMALAGSKDAIQEIGNRLDGKPHQSMDVGHYDLDPQDLGDAELERIAAGGSTRTPKTKGRKEKPTSVH